IVATMQRCVNCRPRDWDRRPRGEIAKSTGGFFFVWTLWALGALGGVTFVLSARGTTAHRSRHDPTRRTKMRRGAARLPGQAGIARPFRRMGCLARAKSCHPAIRSEHDPLAVTAYTSGNDVRTDQSCLTAQGLAVYAARNENLVPRFQTPSR